MTRPTACLVDVFDTVLSFDFAAWDERMAAAAGVEPNLWSAAVQEHLNAVMAGRASLANWFARLLDDVGVAAGAAQVQRLAELDTELLAEGALVYADTVPLLEDLRRRGVAVAFVSNCAENARPLLDRLGLLDLVDFAVLSCEVGEAKPNPLIYEVALQSLGVQAGEAVFVDDQPHYCAGATELGITAVRINRNGAAAEGDLPTVNSLAELTSWF